MPRVRTGKPNGRPRGSSYYTDEVIEELLNRLSDGESLNVVCRDKHMPAMGTVIKWALEGSGREGFGARYLHARKVGYMVLADQMLEAARNPLPGNRKLLRTSVKEGVVTEVVTMDAVDRSRVYIETLKWQLSKMLPKIYGPTRADADDPDGPPLDDPNPDV